MLTGHRPGDAAMHAAGEDEETARRFGPSVRAQSRCWRPTRLGRRNGPTAVRPGRSPPVTRTRALSSAAARCASAPTGRAKSRTDPRRSARPGVRPAGLVVSATMPRPLHCLAEAHVATDNYASRRVVEAAGFTAVDTITEQGEQRVRYVRLKRGSFSPAQSKPGSSTIHPENRRPTTYSLPPAYCPILRRVTAVIGLE
jgi:hypothetical protein